MELSLLDCNWMTLKGASLCFNTLRLVFAFLTRDFWDSHIFILCDGHMYMTEELLAWAVVSTPISLLVFLVGYFNEATLSKQKSILNVPWNMVTNGFRIKGWTTLIFYDFDSATFQILIPFNSQMCDEFGERDEEYSGKSIHIWSFLIIITFSYLLHLSSTPVFTVFYFCCCLKEGVNIL